MGNFLQKEAKVAKGRGRVLTAKIAKVAKGEGEF
jgi:hypothetical protein